MATIGDFVISDECVAYVEANAVSGSYNLIGKGIGRPFNYGYYRNDFSLFVWYCRTTNRIMEMKDLEIFSQAIKDNHPNCSDPKVKDFIKRATEFVLLRN